MKNNRKSSDLATWIPRETNSILTKTRKKLVGVLKSWTQTFDIGIVMFRAIKLNCTDERRPLISFERCVNEISETCETVWNAARLLAANSSARSLFEMSRERGPNLYATEDFILITPLYENSFAPCFKRHTSATKRIKIMPAYCNNLAPFRDSKTRRYLILKRSPTIRVNAMQNHSQSAFDLDKRSWIIFKDL